MAQSDKKQTLLLFSALLGLRLALAATLKLSDEEAFYWALSRAPHAGYVGHPPLITWLISASTWLLGSTAFAVRLPGILCVSLGLAVLLRFTARLGWSSGAKTTVLLCLCSPLLLSSGIPAGPDLPLFAFWCALLDQTYIICTTSAAGRKQWIKLGIFAGFALLSKYTAAMAGLAVVLCLLASLHARHTLLTRWPYLSAAVALAIFSPVLFWNAGHNWPSFELQFAAPRAKAHADLTRWALFWLSQFFLIGPALLGGWFVLLRSATKTRATFTIRFLAIWAATPAAVFFLQPLFGPFKVHWALNAYIPVLVYWAKANVEILNRPLVRISVGLGCWLTLISIGSFYFPIPPEVLSLLERQPIAPAHDVANDLNAWPEFANTWQGLPARFLHLTDTRFDDAGSDIFPSHSCQPVAGLLKSRGLAVAKKVQLHLCEPVL